MQHSADTHGVDHMARGRSGPLLLRLALAAVLACCISGTGHAAAATPAAAAGDHVAVSAETARPMPAAAPLSTWTQAAWYAAGSFLAGGT